jgi:serine/threonine protein kinase
MSVLDAIERRGLPRIAWPGDDGPPPFAEGVELAPGYRVISHLRRGNDLDVYDAWSEERASRTVLKVPRPDHLDDAHVIGRLEGEGRLLAELSHPHIVRAYEYVAGPMPALVLETLGGQTLSHLVSELLEEGPGLGAAELAILGIHLGSALAYLHGREVLHLDLKPSNVIAEAARAKLLDLSLARAPGPGPAGIGTWSYLSPEQARGGVLGPAADVWGLGATLYEAATGWAPFDEPGDDEDSYPQLERRARDIQAERPDLATLSPVVSRALEPDPARRPSLRELMAALEAHSGTPPSERRWASGATG